MVATQTQVEQPSTQVPPQIELFTKLITELEEVKKELKRVLHVAANEEPCTAPRRTVIPLNTKGFIKRNVVDTIEIRANEGCRPDRLMVSSYSEFKPRWFGARMFGWIRRRLAAFKDARVLDHAEHWIIEDIMIDRKSQFAQAGQLPGDMFSSTAIDSFVSFDTLKQGAMLQVIVRYVGPYKAARFNGGMFVTLTGNPQTNKHLGPLMGPGD